MRRVFSLLCVALLLAAPVSAATAALPSDADWPTWTKDPRGSRYNQAEHKITAATAANLQLKWTFALPKAAAGVTLRSQPAIVGGRLYFGGTDGKFYALDAKTGATKWTFDLATVDPALPMAMVRDSPAVADGRIYFGDYRGYLYALDQRTGALLWTTRLDTHPAARLTSSPIVYKGRVYAGIASADNTGGVDAECCTFRGQIDAVDARTGAVVWRHYTVPQPQAAGTWPSGATKYEPSGVGVWSSPSVDPLTDTLYVGTGQNYTGTAGESDSVLALDAFSGAVKWKNQLTHPDTWRALCVDPNAPPGYCPGLQDGTALDYDIGTSPNIFTVKGRTLVGVGQKSGVYHVLDARTGQIVWQRQLSDVVVQIGLGGIQWGASYDGQRLYVATNNAKPGALHALDPETGALLWKTDSPADGCSWGGGAAEPRWCTPANLPAVTSTPGVVYEGSSDGKMRAYAASDGHVLWQFDTVRDFDGVNGLTGHGAGIAGAGGAVVSGGMLYVLSGYFPFYTSDKGFVLLAFGL